MKVRGAGCVGCTRLVTARLEELPFDSREFERLRTGLSAPWDHEVIESAAGHHLVIRVPSDVPDAVTHLERALEEAPGWLLGRIGSVFLMGAQKTVHVPGYTAEPVLAERLHRERIQAENLRKRLTEGCDWIVFRSEGDPLRLVRFGVRIPRQRVEELTEADLGALAYTTQNLRQSGTHEKIGSVLIVADSDHLRIRPTDFFSDLADRKAVHRPRMPVRRPTEVGKPPELGNSEAGFPTPSYRVEPVLPPRRRVESVEPLLEIEEEIDAKPSDIPSASRTLPPGLVVAVDARRMELGASLAVKILRVKGFRVLENVYHGPTVYVAAAERSEGTPAKVVVRALSSVGLQDIDDLVLAARALGADLLLALAPDVRPEVAARAAGTRVKVVRPEDVAGLTF